jgi:hypothetical protein
MRLAVDIKLDSKEAGLGQTRIILTNLVSIFLILLPHIPNLGFKVFIDCILLPGLR